MAIGETKWANFIFRSSMNHSECDAFAGVICISWMKIREHLNSGNESFVILTKFTSLEVLVVISTKFTSVEVLRVVILTSSYIVRKKIVETVSISAIQNNGIYFSRGTGSPHFR